MTVYLTGDTHGHFERVARFCEAYGLTSDDVVIILGDAGVNYFGEGSARDRASRALLGGLAPTFFCIHGNHEMRPQSLSCYREASWRGGTVFVEDAWPNLLFAKDGELFDFDGVRAFVVGGAYSIDKRTRLKAGLRWFSDEQPDEATKRLVEERLEEIGWDVDVMITHTCPFHLEPREVFVAGVDQSMVDTSTEKWLDDIERRLSYRQWYCGHFHTSKQVGSFRIMFEDWDVLWPHGGISFDPTRYGAATEPDRRTPAQLARDLDMDVDVVREELAETDGLHKDARGAEVCRETRVGTFIGRRFWERAHPEDFPYGQCESCRRWFMKRRLRIADIEGTPEEDQPLVCPDCHFGIGRHAN